MLLKFFEAYIYIFRRMKFLLIACLAVPAILAQQTSAPGGNLCTYPPQGDESNQKAVPIQDFRTSGLDFVRSVYVQKLEQL